MLKFIQHLFKEHSAWEALIQTGRGALETNQYAEAEEAFRGALREAENDEQVESIAVTLMWLANICQRQHRHSEAVPLLTRALTIWESVAEGRNQHVVQVLHGLSQACSAQEKFEEAIEYLARALAAAEAMWGPNDTKVARILEELSWVHGACGNYPTAETLCRRALRIEEASSERADEKIVSAILRLMIYCRRQNRKQETDALLVQLLELLRKADHDPVFLATSVNAKGHELLLEHRYGAEDILLNALLIRERILDPNHRDIAQTLNNLGILYREQSRHAEAEQVLTRAIDVYVRALGPDDQFVAMAHFNLALVLQDTERYEETDAHWQRAVSVIQSAPGTDRKMLVQILECYVEFLKKTNRHTEAETFESRARAIRDG